jgi:hypothetical protein
MMVVLYVLAAVLVLSAFVALYVWTRRSERDISYDKPGIPEDQANGLRFGIGMGANQGSQGNGM